MSEEKLRMLRPGSFPAYLLMLVALSGEFPTTLTHRLSASKSYADFAVKGLKHDNLLRTYYHNGLRGLRLTAHAKKLLSAEYPDRFASLFTGDTATSTPKYTLVHRLRLHRMAEVLVTMLNAGVTALPWESRLCLPPCRSLTLRTLTGPLITAPERSKISA